MILYTLVAYADGASYKLRIYVTQIRRMQVCRSDIMIGKTAEYLTQVSC